MSAIPRFMACLALLTWGTYPAIAQEPDGPDAPPARGTPAPPVSPEVDAEGRVTFRVRAPKASEVQAIGEFSRGKVSLEKDAAGIWSATVGPLSPEIYHYYFTIDGVKALDLSNPRVKSGSTARTISSILVVPSKEPMFYDARAVPHGVVHECLYQSKSLDALRPVSVYTPAGYDPAAATRYPVLYLLHGANADETAWTRLGRAQLIVDNLIASGAARPMIVVMPFGYAQPPSATQGRSEQNRELFGRDLLEDLVPFVEKTFRVRADREQRAIAGLSMGGAQALGIGLNNLDTFSHVAGFSAAVRQSSDNPAFTAVVSDPAETNRRLRLLWLGCGSDDSLYEGNKQLAGFFQQRGVKNVFHDTDGGHTWIVARRYLHAVVPLLFVETAANGR